MRGGIPVEGAPCGAVPCAFVFFVDCESGSGAFCAREDVSVGFWPGCHARAWRLWFGAWAGWSVFGLRWVSDPYALRRCVATVWLQAWHSVQGVLCNVLRTGC